MAATRHECEGGIERPEWALAVVEEGGTGMVLVSAGSFDKQLAFDATMMLRPVPRCPFCGERLGAAERREPGPERPCAKPEVAASKPARRAIKPVQRVVRDPRDADDEKVCAVCGELFVNKVATARYCSPKCRAEGKRRLARKSRGPEGEEFKPSPKKVERYIPRSHEQWEEDAEMWRQIRLRSCGGI